MKNTNYYAEMLEAQKYLNENKNDEDLQMFFEDIRDDEDMPHSQRWSSFYDFLTYHDPYIDKLSTIVTGLAYLSEN